MSAHSTRPRTSNISRHERLTRLSAEPLFLFAESIIGLIERIKYVNTKWGEFSVPFGASNDSLFSIENDFNRVPIVAHKNVQQQNQS